MPKPAMMGRAHATPPEGGRHATLAVACAFGARRGNDCHQKKKYWGAKSTQNGRSIIMHAIVMSSHADRCCYKALFPPRGVPPFKNVTASLQQSLLQELSDKTFQKRNETRLSEFSFAHGSPSSRSEDSPIPICHHFQHTETSDTRLGSEKERRNVNMRIACCV